MNCLWENYCQAPLKFCEEVLCQWVRQPGNAFSSFLYIIVGLYIIRITKKRNATGVGLLGIAGIVLGIGSFFFHATGTCFAAELDYLGMFLITGAMTGLNWLRLRPSSNWKAAYIVTVVTTVSLHAATCFFPSFARLIFTFGSPCCVLELYLWIRDRPKVRYRFYWLGWAIVSLAAFFWWLDLQPEVCIPGRHWISGHALWHFLTAFSLFPLTLFFMEFSVLQDKRRSYKAM